LGSDGNPDGGSGAAPTFRLAPAGHRRPTCNAELTAETLRTHCRLDDAGHELLRTAVERLGLSARGTHRALKLARTIADLDGARAIAPAHLAEALQYRPRSPG
jgi:magnesium chelatase family protein